MEGEIVLPDQQNSLQNSSDIKPFKPTPGMKVFLDTALRLMTDNIAEITREAGIDESNYYKWLKKKPGFIDWFNTEWNNRLKSVGWKLDAIGMQRAKFDHKYWQDMQRRVGNFSPDSGNNNNIAIQTNINLDKYIK